MLIQCMEFPQTLNTVELVENKIVDYLSFFGLNILLISIGKIIQIVSVLHFWNNWYYEKVKTCHLLEFWFCFNNTIISPNINYCILAWG